MRINGEVISEEQVVEYLSFMFRYMEKEKVELSFFDITTLVCLQYFKDSVNDFNILEVGLGGLNDSTNIIRQPLLSIITSISYDH